MVVRWWYPPANPGNANAWICLWHAEEVRWGQTSGECIGKKLQWRIINSQARAGAMPVKIRGADGNGGPTYPDGQYVFSMQPDYGALISD